MFLLPREGSTRKRLSASQKESPHQKPNPARSSASRSPNLRFQNCEKINFCSLSHQVYGILLWQSKQTTEATFTSLLIAWSLGSLIVCS